MKGQGIECMINQCLLGHKVEVTDGKRIWYVAELIGFLMEVDLFSGKLTAIWKIPDSMHPCAYRSLFYCDHKLYIFPYYRRTMYIYDLYTTRYEEIEVDKKLQLMEGIKRDKFLYVFGVQSKILKFNLADHTITYIDMQLELRDLEKLPQFWFWTNAIVSDECIYMPVGNTNMIVALDRFDHVSLKCLGEKPEERVLANIHVDSGRYRTIYCKGEKNNLTTYMAEYDFNGKLIQKSIIEEKYPYQTYPFFTAVWNRNKWICFPFGRNEILLRDEERDELLFTMDKGIDFLNSTIAGLFCCSVLVDEDILCSVNQSTGSLICIDRNDLIVKHSYLELEENQHRLVEKGYQDAFQSHYDVREVKDFYSLQSYIEYICTHENRSTNGCTQIGKMVYEKTINY